MRFAAMNLLVGSAERAESFEGLDLPERKAGLLAPRALAYDAMGAALRQCSRSVSYGFSAQDSGVFSSDARWSSADQP